jgi:hypothetical protein
MRASAKRSCSTVLSLAMSCGRITPVTWSSAARCYPELLPRGYDQIAVRQHLGHDAVDPYRHRLIALDLPFAGIVVSAVE